MEEVVEHDAVLRCLPMFPFGFSKTLTMNSPKVLDWRFRDCSSVNSPRNSVD